MSDESFAGGHMDPYDHPEHLSGYFLISGTELVDPNFYRTVILCIEHAEEGAFGLVVNRPAEVQLGSVYPPLENTPAGELPVYVGGPVQQEYMFVLHRNLPSHLISEHAAEPTPGVYFEPATEQLFDYLNNEWRQNPDSRGPKIHVFAGYSGWGAGQLESELEQGSWFTHRADPDIIFHTEPEQGWKDALAEKGPLFRIVAETGHMPSMN